MIRFAVIGAGAWGLNYVRMLASEPGSELALVVDPDPDATQRARTIAPDIAVTADAEHALSDPTIDAIVIASPALTHAALAIEALRCGKHVLIEKPLALNLVDALAVGRAAHASDRTSMVGHLMVYHPAVVRLRELLRSGGLGKLHYVHSTRVNLGRLRQDENALWSFGPHDLSMIDLLLEGMPDTVSASGLCVLQPGVEDVVFLTLRYPSGELAHVHLSWLSPRKERRLTLVCSKKMVEFDDVSTEKLRIYDKGYDRPPSFTEYGQYLTIRDGDVHIPQISMQEPLRLQIRHFLACIAERRVPETNVMTGVRVTSILDAAQRSLAEGGAVVAITRV